MQPAVVGQPREPAWEGEQTRPQAEQALQQAPTGQPGTLSYGATTRRRLSFSRNTRWMVARPRVWPSATLNQEKYRMVATVSGTATQSGSPGMKSCPAARPRRGTPATGPRSAGPRSGERGREEGPRPAPGATAAAGSTGSRSRAPTPRRLGGRQVRRARW